MLSEKALVVTCGPKFSSSTPNTSVTSPVAGLAWAGATVGALAADVGLISAPGAAAAAPVGCAGAEGIGTLHAAASVALMPTPNSTLARRNARRPNCLEVWVVRAMATRAYLTRLESRCAVALQLLAAGLLRLR